MTARDIFGDRLLPMMEYVGWLKEYAQQDFIVKYVKSNLLSKEPVGWGREDLTVEQNKSNFNTAIVLLTRKAHRILAQKMDIGWFVKPTFSKVVNSMDHVEYADEYLNNWKSMFEGEWEVKKHPESGFDMILFQQGDYYSWEFISDFKTLNDFASYAFKNNVKLIINKDYEFMDR